MWENTEKFTIKMAYGVIMRYHLNMPSYREAHLLNIPQ